jgi:hypothetical protein
MKANITVTAQGLRLDRGVFMAGPRSLYSWTEEFMWLYRGVYMAGPRSLHGKTKKMMRIGYAEKLKRLDQGVDEARLST